jgi:hypothetical protein
MLQRWVEGLPVSCVVGVAVQEFESWLLGDHKAVCDVVGQSIKQTAEPESMGRREAKELLAEWSGNSSLEPTAIRCDLANTCNLETVAERCPSFRSFLAELKHAMSGSG